MPRKQIRNLSLLLILVMVTALILYHLSFNIALSKSGMDRKHIQYIDTGIANGGREYRAVFQNLSDEGVKLLYLTKNKLGIWRVTDQAAETEYGFASMGWMRTASLRSYAVGDQTRWDWEVHTVCAGRNAVRQIEISPELLPPNVAVNVFQAGTAYVIHFVSYGEVETLNRIPIMDILKEYTGIAEK